MNDRARQWIRNPPPRSSSFGRQFLRFCGNMRVLQALEGAFALSGRRKQALEFFG
jgi:hypothetical protein